MQILRCVIPVVRFFESSLPGPCCVVLAMIHLTRQHFIRDLRESRGFCHLEPSVCPPGFGSFPLASGIRPPSTAFSSAWRQQKRHYPLRAKRETIWDTNQPTGGWYPISISCDVDYHKSVHLTTPADICCNFFLLIADIFAKITKWAKFCLFYVYPNLEGGFSFSPSGFWLIAVGCVHFIYLGNFCKEAYKTFFLSFCLSFFLLSCPASSLLHSSGNAPKVLKTRKFLWTFRHPTMKRINGSLLQYFNAAHLT